MACLSGMTWLAAIPLAQPQFGNRHAKYLCSGFEWRPTPHAHRTSKAFSFSITTHRIACHTSMPAQPLLDDTFLRAQWSGEFDAFETEPESAQLLARLRNWASRDLLNERALDSHPGRDYS
jgi:hypothetical protein